MAGWVAVQIELLEVFDCGGEPAVRDGSCDPSLAQHRDGLDVNQVRRGDVTGGAEFLAGSPATASVRA